MLPPTVKAAVAAMDLKEDFDKTVKHADYVYNAVKGAQPVAVVTPGNRPTASAVTPADLDSSADAPALDQVATLAQEIAAFNKTFKSAKNQMSQGKGGGAKGGAGKPQHRGRGKPHPDGPPPESCKVHWQYGRNAFYCLQPDTCPWAHIIATPKPKPKK